MTKQMRLGIGSVLSTIGALGVVLSIILGWAAAPPPWGSLLGFVFGVAAGLGVTLVVAGLKEHGGG